MAEHPRIDELRRRVERDPASIAFAQLAEEHRRAGDFEEAVRVCTVGLERHPAYLSARVTLARALVELGRLEEAETEFGYVVTAAPDNIIAVRALAEIRERRGDAAATAASTPAATPEPQISTNDSDPDVSVAQPEGAEEPAPALEVSSFALDIEQRDARPRDSSPPPVSANEPHDGDLAEPERVASEMATARVPGAVIPMMDLDVEPTDPVLEELEAWLAVLSRQRAARAGTARNSPHSQHRLR